MSEPSLPAVLGERTLAWGRDIILHPDGGTGTPLPQPDADKVLYWIVDAWGYLRVRHRRKGRGPSAAWWRGLFGSFSLDFTMRLGGRRPYDALTHITPIAVPAIDAAFDDLWARCRAQMPDVLLTVRDAAALRDRLADDADARLLRFDRDGELLGYILLRRDDDATVGLNRFVIADLLIDGFDPKVAQALFAAAYEYATAKRCQLLEFPAPPSRIAELVWSHKPYVRTTGMPTPSVSIADLALRAALTAPDAWYLTALDRDTL